MANLNKPLCATNYGNTGVGDCFLEPDKFIGSIQVPSNFQIAQSDVAGLLAYLETKIHAAIGTRIFPGPKLINLTDNSEDSTINTTDYGDKIFVKDGFYDWTFRYQKGGVLLHQELAKNQGANKFFLFFDKNNKLYGYKSGAVLKGIPVDQYRVPPWRLNTGSEAALYSQRFIIDPIYLNNGNLGFLEIGDAFNLVDLVGLQDVELTIIDQAANVATVQVRSKISDVNLYDAYKTNLLQTSAWRLYKSDGTLSSVTGVADNAGDEGFDVTANYTAWAAEFDGAEMIIKLAIPSVLKAPPISMSGFEDKDGVAFIVESASS
jgi:hypothetical protein